LIARRMPLSTNSIDARPHSAEIGARNDTGA
jgi:hypothetical protein